MSTSRDTQFKGFAKWLWQEVRDLQRQQIDSLSDGLVHTSAEWDEESIHLIVQRAYDLVKHALNTVPYLLKVADQAKTVEEVLVFVPDIVKSSEAQE